MTQLSTTASGSLPDGSLPADPPGLLPGAIAAEAAATQRTDELRRAVLAELEQQIKHTGKSKQRQYEQAVLWRRLNLAVGLAVGLLVAGSGTSGLIAKDTTAAAVLAALATFGTGALTTLNAGQKKAQAVAAGSAYEELEVAGIQLRDVEMPYAPIEDVLVKVNAITARRMALNRVAEPPSTRAFSRADRAIAERHTYRRPLTFAERHAVMWWAKPPARAQQQHQRHER